MLNRNVSEGYDDEVAEWLRRWTANPMGSARVGSNPIFVEIFTQSLVYTHCMYNYIHQTSFMIICINLVL